MRVLHVIWGIDRADGGPTAALCVMAAAQARAGADVSVLATWCREAELVTAERLRAAGVTVRLIGPARGALRVHRELKHAVERMVAGADVVHVRGVWEDVQYRAATAAWRAGVPYVVRPCGMLDPTSLRHHRWRKSAYMAWRLRRVLDRAAAMHYTTEGERAACAPLRIAAPAIVEPLGLEMREFAQAATAGGAAAAAAFRREWPRLGDRPYVIFLGRLCAEKGLDVLIPAFARSRRGRAMLVIAGPDYRGYRAGVERAVHECGVADDVLFTGMLDGPRRSAALAGAELFVMPSRHENFGLAAAEAMAARLPVMVSEHVCLSDDVRRAGAGAVVRLDVEAWAAEISRWLADPALRAAAADGGAHLARERYDADRVARAWLGHYERAVGAVRGRRGGA